MMFPLDRINLQNLNLVLKTHGYQVQMAPTEIAAAVAVRTAAARSWMGFRLVDRIGACWI